MKDRQRERKMTERKKETTKQRELRQDSDKGCN